MRAQRTALVLRIRSVGTGADECVSSVAVPIVVEPPEPDTVGAKVLGNANVRAHTHARAALEHTRAHARAQP
jgi:hypothetical protein